MICWLTLTVNKKGEFDDKIRRFDKRIYLFRIKE